MFSLERIWVEYEGGSDGGSRVGIVVAIEGYQGTLTYVPSSFLYLHS